MFHLFPTLDQAKAFAGSDDLRTAMGRAGVSGKPRIETLAQVREGMAALPADPPDPARRRKPSHLRRS